MESIRATHWLTHEISRPYYSSECGIQPERLFPKRLAQSRHVSSGTSLGGKFYICGHNLDDSVGKLCEVYDPAQNKWEPIASAEFNHDYNKLGKQAIEQNYRMQICTCTYLV